MIQNIKRLVCAFVGHQDPAKYIQNNGGAIDVYKYCRRCGEWYIP